MSGKIMSPDRFWEKVDRTGEHWLWTGLINFKGYGLVGYKGKQIKAHRYAWMITYGLIPNRLHVLHRCDIRLCCKPECLFLGTNLDNIEDRIRKGRGNHKTWPKTSS